MSDPTIDPYVNRVLRVMEEWHNQVSNYTRPITGAEIESIGYKLHADIRAVINDAYIAGAEDVASRLHQEIDKMGRLTSD